MPHVIQSIARLWLHGNIDVVCSGKLDGARVTRVCVAENAHTGIAGENAL
jgi:hypothetical protein